MATTRISDLRKRLEGLPATVWIGVAAALMAALLALAESPNAAMLMVVAAIACLWAGSESRRSSIAAHQDVVSGADLSELAPFLEALPDPALLVDEHGRIAGSNAAARRQMQFEARSQLLVSIIRHPDVLEAVQAAMGDGETRTVAYENPRQGARHTRCYAAPVTWGADRAAMLVFHDETERVANERMRADFLANASHELRTPLSSLTLLIETISGPARDNAADRDRFLAMMQVQASRMRRLIDDLLSLSRIELDERVPPADRTDLNDVVRDVADQMTALAQERKVSLRLNLQADPATVVGDRFQLAQVVQNLIDNAIKYSPDGGEVNIEVARSGDRDEVNAQAGRRWEEAGRLALVTPAAPPANRSYAYVRVEDRGPGIAMHFLPRLGERFFRVERETGPERGGTGLGLAIVKHIINRHRGGFLVESLPGRGTAFAIFIESTD